MRIAAADARATLAATTLSGSPALNVIASRATAGLNIRIMVGDTVAGVVEHVRKAVRDDQVQITVVEANEPSPVSPYEDDEAFDVMMAATDARFFTTISERVYRFAPFRMSKQQREAIHSYDERIGVADFLDGVGWYRHLIERLPDE